MASNIRIKRSAVANKVPTTSDLSLGELAINFYDGKLFLKQDTSGVGVATTVIAVNPQALTTSSSPTFQNLTVVSQIGIGATSYKGASGQFLKSTGTGLTWEALTAAAPGNNTEVVFNNTGSLGASSNFTWNGTSLYVNGSVGIGTTNPAPGIKLDVVGGEIRAGRIDTNEEGGQVSFSRASDNLTAWYIDVYGSTSTPSLRFIDVSNSAIRSVIDGSGNFLINAASATGTSSQPLQVSGGAYVSGNLGVGATNPTSTLHVVGTSLVTGISTFSDTTDSSSTTTGSLQTRGGLAVAKNIIVGVGISAAGIITCSDLNSTSDINLKTNIKPIQNPIEKILKIEGVNFDWKQDNRKSMGVVAQNIEEVLPELVSGGDTKTVNYNGLIGLLIEAIKDQQKQIDELKDQINNK